MRFFVCCVLAVLIAVVASVPVAVDSVKENGEALYDVDIQGHENVGDREARQFGYGGYRGGYGFGGYRGGYGGLGGFGGYRGGYGGYGGYHHGYGDYRGGFYG